MKIKELAIQSFTNPFGNILAITSLAMFSLGQNQLFWSQGWEKLANDLNAPAILIASILIGKSAGLVLPPLIYLQWIFIGGFAKAMAREIKSEVD